MNNLYPSEYGSQGMIPILTRIGLAIASLAITTTVLALAIVE